MYLKEKYDPDSQDVYIYALKPITDSAVIGEPYTLPSIVRAYMTNGTMMDVPVTWSENPVDTSAAGLKTSVATAISDPTKTTTAKIDVAGIDYLNDMTVTVNQNDPYSLPSTVLATLTNGKSINTAVTWNNDVVNTSVLGVQERIGTSVIDPTKTIVLTIEVVPQTVTGVSLNQTELDLGINDTYQLIAQVEPDNAYNKVVDWSSSDPAIASVSVSGLVTAHSSGQTTITVTTDDGSFTASCLISVNVPVTGVTLDKTDVTARRGSQFFLTATVLPESADNKTVSWSSTNTNVATVNNSGMVEIRSGGYGWNPTPSDGSWTTIQVTTEDGSYTAECRVTVGIPVTGVTLMPGSVNLNVGDSRNMTATVSPNDAYNKNVTWQSDKPDIVTVSSNGRIQAVAAGTAVITVTTVDGGFSAQSSITVSIPSLRATGINGSTSSYNRNWFELTFNNPIISASMAGASDTVTGNTVRFTKTSGSYSTGRYTVTVTDTYNQQINVTVELSYSSWYGYRWSIFSQG